MNVFPAILVGGPPHSGKSVLVYNLTQALRKKQSAHYVLPACPDGEGDWSQEAERGLAQVLRVKGKFNENFVTRTSRAIQERHMPLLVDVGGRPTAEQQNMFAYCSHAILLIRDDKDNPAAYQQDLAHWQQMLTKQNVSIIAQLKSRLHGDQELISQEPIVSGIVTNLERGKEIKGMVLDALVAKLSTLFAFSDEQLAAVHLSQAPVELALDLPVLARTLGSLDGRWQPTQLPDVQTYLPEGVALGLYGRSPNWLNAFLAIQAYPEPVWLFNPRDGWVRAPQFPLVAALTTKGQAGWHAEQKITDAYTLLTLKTSAQLLDIDQPALLPLPLPQGDLGLVISGRVPHWLMAGAARQLAQYVPWIAIFYPPMKSAVVVFAVDNQQKVGSVMPIIV